MAVPRFPAARRAGSLAALALLCGAAGAADGPGEIFRWEDEHGRVHYGDRPPDRHARRLDVDTDPPEDRHLGERRERRERLLEALAAARREREAAEQRAREARRERERRCAEARERLRSYATAGYLYEEDAQGRRRVLTAAEHDRARAEAQALVEKWCD